MHITNYSAMYLQVLDRILKVDYRLPRQPRVSEECKDLIRRILVADPALRLTIPQIQVCCHRIQLQFKI